MDGNYSKFGFTLQKCICDRYDITPNSEKAKVVFNSSFDNGYISNCNKLVDKIFTKIGLKPISCTTFDKTKAGKDVPFNFILEDNSSLSIRTNIKGDKVAPRAVGQAGYKKLNEYFKTIYGKEIQNQFDIKQLVCLHINEIFPIFLDNLFDADFIVWVNKIDVNDYDCEIVKGDNYADIEFDKRYFSFTRDIDQWVESNTIKYKGKSIAEVQVHKNRTFKFRFSMEALLPYVKEKQINNETLGMTAEKVICNEFGLDFPVKYNHRSFLYYEEELKPLIEEVFKTLPTPIKYTGNKVGTRGGASKCSYDFVLKGNKTLSLKTNIGKMVCPPEVGQPNDLTCYKYFKDFVNSDHIDKANFKNMVFSNVEMMIPIYVEHMFDSDYLLRISIAKNQKNVFKYEIFEKNYGQQMNWEKKDFDFSKNSIEEWNESNTLYYKKISIGEFQIHSNRNCFKFRFNFDNLVKIISNFSSGK